MVLMFWEREYVFMLTWYSVMFYVLSVQCQHFIDTPEWLVFQPWMFSEMACVTCLPVLCHSCHRSYHWGAAWSTYDEIPESPGDQENTFKNNTNTCICQVWGFSMVADRWGFLRKPILQPSQRSEQMGRSLGGVILAVGGGLYSDSLQSELLGKRT